MSVGSKRLGAAPRFLVAVVGVLMLMGIALPLTGGSGAGAANPTGQIRVRFNICPAGFDLQKASADQLFDKCNGSANGTKYEVRSGSGSRLIRSGVIAAQGKLTFSQLDTAGYSVREIIPSGFAKPRVFCRVRTSATGNQSAPIERFAFQSSSSQATYRPMDVTHTNGFGTQWDCTFFHVKK
jgi:hypothetical protein